MNIVAALFATAQTTAVRWPGRDPRGKAKTLFASAHKLIPQVIGEAFADVHRRDPGQAWPRLAVVDGNNVRPREPPRPACGTGRI